MDEPQVETASRGPWLSFQTSRITASIWLIPCDLREPLANLALNFLVLQEKEIGLV